MTKGQRQHHASGEGPATDRDRPNEQATDAAPDPAAQAREAENAELRSGLLRALAEMENVRRRARRDVEAAEQYAITAFARDLLNVADNLERALASTPEDVREKAKAFYDGVSLTDRELQNVLARYGVVKQDPLGHPFDPNSQEVVFEESGTEAPAGTVTRVLAPGYSLGSRVLRAAKVGVASDDA